jgi:hypothetical protein
LTLERAPASAKGFLVGVQRSGGFELFVFAQLRDSQADRLVELAPCPVLVAKYWGSCHPGTTLSPRTPPGARHGAG